MNLRVKFVFYKQLYLILFLFVFIEINHTQAANITAVANGKWSSTSTWSTHTIPTSSDSVTIGAGFSVTITANATSGSLSGAGNILCTASGANLTIGGNNASTTFSGVISSTKRLNIIKTGSGTLTFSGANTYTGTTTISAGTLKLGSVSALGSTDRGTVVASGAVLDLNGFTLSTAEGLTLNGTGISSGGALINSSLTAVSYSGAITLASNSSIVANNGAITLTGAISGSRSITIGGVTGGTISGVIGIGGNALTKEGAGTWKLSGVNTYTGITTINDGILSVATIGNGGMTGNLGKASAAAANIVLGGGTLLYTGVTASTNRAYTLSAGTTSTINISSSSTNLTISGAGANTTGSLIKTGAGTLTLSATNLYTGTTTINAGALTYGINNALSSGPVTISGTTAVLNLLTYTDVVGTVTVDNNASITGSTGILTSTGTFEMKSGQVNAILAGTGIALNKTTNGTVTLSKANTYTGLTTVSAGTLIAGTDAPSGAAGAFGNATSAIVLGNAATTTNNSSPALLTGGAYTVARNITVANQATSGLYTIGGNTDNISTFSGVISLNQPLFVAQIATSGGNTLKITGGISSANTGMKNLTFNNVGTVSVDTAAIANGSGSVALFKQNSGVLNLNVASTYTGGTTLIAGILNINNANALGGVASPFVINGGIIDNTSGGEITTINYPQTWGGDFTFTGTYNLNLGEGAVSLSNNRQLTISANTLTVGGVISGAAYNLTKTGTATLAMGANTVTLNSLIINTGILTAPSTLNIAGNFTNNGVFTHNNGLVVFNGTSAQTILGSAPTGFNNLTLNNSNGLIINTSPTINGVLTFVSGKITTGSNHVTLGVSAVTSGVGNGKYIYGNEIINIPNAMSPSKTFDIGDATNYTPVTLSFSGTTSGSGSIMANTVTGQHPSITTSGINYSKDVNRYFTLTNNGVGGFTSYAPTFTFVAEDVIGGANSGNFVIKKHNATWTETTIGERTSTSTQATGITTFSDFVIGEPQTLDHFTFTLSDQQAVGYPFVGTNTLTARDVSNNIYTLFDASVNNVTISANLPLTGYLSGLSGSNVLIHASDFLAGVANLSGLLIYMGDEGTGTFTATSADGKTGTTAIPININSSTLNISTVGTQTAGEAFSVTITAKDYNGNPVNAITDSYITLGLANGSGTLGGTLEGVMFAGNSNVTINGVIYTKAESGVVLTAIQTSGLPIFVAGTSNSFSVKAGTPTHLAISNIGTQTASANFGVIVTAFDAYDNIAKVTTDAGISISVATGTGSLSSGNTTGIMTAGTNNIVISNIKYNVAESGVSLLVTHTSGIPLMTACTSNSFLVIPDTNLSVLSPLSANLIANGNNTQILQVQTKDALGNNLNKGGAVVLFNKISGIGSVGPVTDNGNGTYSAVVTSPTTVGSGVFEATIYGKHVKNGTGHQVQTVVNFTPGMANASKSTLSPLTASVPDDGLSTQALLVQAVDENGNYLTSGGSTVVFTKQSGVGNISAVTDNGNGTYTAYASSAIAGDGVFTATLNGSPVMSGSGSPSTSTITFTLGSVDASKSTLTPAFSTIEANGISTQVLIVQAKDATGNNLTTGGDNVIISLKSGTGTVDEVNDNNDGTYTASVTAPSSPGSGVFSATINGNNVESGTGSNTEAVIYYGSDADLSTLTPVTESITADGTSTIELTVQAKDSNGNNISVGGESVTITRLSGKGSIGSVTDNGDGTYTAIVTSHNNPSSGDFVATLNGSPVKSGSSSQTTSTITYADVANATYSTLTPTTSNVYADGISTVLLTVQAKDVNGNNLSTGGATVTITKLSGLGTISEVTDNDDGTYSATVTAPVVPGNGIFIATFDGSPVKNGSSSQTQATVTYSLLPYPPDMPSSISGSTDQYPGFANQIYSISSVFNASTYTWTVPTGWTITAGQGTTTITVTPGNVGQNGNITVTAGNIYGTSAPQTKAVSVLPGRTLNLTSLLLEVLYNGGGIMRQAYDENGPHWPAGVADHITVELHSAANYSEIIYTVTDVPLSIIGEASILVPAVYNDSYYITIKHRNSIETTSSDAVSFAVSTITKSFALSSDAYGDNINISGDGFTMIYGGEINQDGIIDLSDFIPVETEASMASAGYMPEDVNGDGLVDLSDFLIIEINSSMAIGVITP